MHEKSKVERYDDFAEYLQSDIIKQKLSYNIEHYGLSTRLFNDFGSMENNIRYEKFEHLCQYFIALSHLYMKQKETGFQEWWDEALELVFTDLFDKGSIKPSIIDALKSCDFHNKIIETSLVEARELLANCYITFMGEEIVSLFAVHLSQEQLKFEQDNAQPEDHTVLAFSREFAAQREIVTKCFRSGETSLCLVKEFLERRSQVKQAKQAHEEVQTIKSDIISGEAIFNNFDNPGKTHVYDIKIRGGAVQIIEKRTLDFELPGYVRRQLAIINELEEKGCKESDNRWIEVSRKIEHIATEAPNREKSKSYVQRMNRYQESASGKAYSEVKMFFKGVMDNMGKTNDTGNLVFHSFILDNEPREGYITATQRRQLDYILFALEQTNQGEEKRSNVWSDVLKKINEKFDQDYAPGSTASMFDILPDVSNLLPTVADVSSLISFSSLWGGSSSNSQPPNTAQAPGDSPPKQSWWG